MRLICYKAYSCMMITDDSHIHIIVFQYFSNQSLLFSHVGVVVTVIRTLVILSLLFSVNKLINYHDYSILIIQDDFNFHDPIIQVTGAYSFSLSKVYFSNKFDLSLTCKFIISFNIQMEQIKLYEKQNRHTMSSR